MAFYYIFDYKCSCWTITTNPHFSHNLRETYRLSKLLSNFDLVLSWISDFTRYFENWTQLKTLFEIKPPLKMLIKIFPRKLETCLRLSKNSPNQCTTKKPETTQSAHQSSNSIPYRFLKRRGLSQKLTIKSCVQDWF